MNVCCASPWIPAEWIKAHGHEPRGVWALSELGNQPLPLAEGVCPFAQAVLSLAEARPDSAFVFAATCDQIRRAFDSLVVAGHTRAFLFNIPATWQTPAARKLYHAETARLGKFLEALGGQPPNPEQLAAVIRQYDQRRARVREFMTRASARATAEAIARFFSCEENPSPLERERGQPCPQLQSAAASADEAVRAPAAKDSLIPLALVGGPLLQSQWSLFDTIESAGGRVVLNATEPGERCLLPPMSKLTHDQNPVTALADHHFANIVDVFQRPNSRLYTWLEPRLRSRKVRGIVILHNLWCDLWRAEAASLRQAFGMPVLLLEAHQVHAGGLRDANRLAAFIESLE